MIRINETHQTLNIKFDACRVSHCENLVQMLEIETGYGESNTWLELIEITVHVHKTDCYACLTEHP